MTIATLSSKRQITVPAQIARGWNLEQGDGLMFIEEGDSVRVLPIKRRSLLEMRGSVKTQKPFKSIKELRRIAREEHTAHEARPKS
jgi:AbrB family looped-hinge helix DNA binding protein